MLAEFPSPMWIPIVAIGAPMILAMVHVVCKAMSRTICHWRDTSLKMRLIEQGLNATEIAQIVNAGRQPLPAYNDHGESKSCQSQDAHWNTASGKPPIKPAMQKPVSV